MGKQDKKKVLKQPYQKQTQQYSSKTSEKVNSGGGYKPSSSDMPAPKGNFRGKGDRGKAGPKVDFTELNYMSTT